MIQFLYKRYRRWRCRRQFKRLPYLQQQFIKFWGQDPESLIRKGVL